MVFDIDKSNKVLIRYKKFKKIIYVNVCYFWRGQKFCCSYFVRVKNGNLSSVETTKFYYGISFFIVLRGIGVMLNTWYNAIYSEHKFDLDV